MYEVDSWAVEALPCRVKSRWGHIRVTSMTSFQRFGIFRITAIRVSMKDTMAKISATTCCAVASDLSFRRTFEHVLLDLIETNDF